MENLLKNQNPWWKEPHFINSDIRILEFESQNYRYYPKLLSLIDVHIPSILTLRGPRQVGKSTLIKLIIRKLLLQEKIDPKQICFYSCEDIDNYHALIKLLESYYDYLDLYGLAERKNFIFLDEISFVDQWPRGIKSLYERGKFKDSFLILTGSNSHDLRLEAEQLPGRRGNVEKPDKILLPLTFREYSELIIPTTSQKLPALSINDILECPEKADNLKHLSAFSDEIHRLLYQFFLTGGYLRTINNFMKNQAVSNYVYEIYQQWIRGDIIKLKRSEIVASHIFSQIMLKIVSRIDWTSIAKSIDVDSPKTVSDYLKILEDFFITRIVYQYDIQRKMVRPKKLKKVYFLDPFIFWTVRGWVEKWPDFFAYSRDNVKNLYPFLSEQYVFNSLNYGVDLSKFYERTFFYTEKSGAEIDFITLDNSGEPVAIEVKYQNQFDIRDFSIMIKTGIERGILITKDTLKTDIKKGFVAIPFYAWIVLNIN